MSKNILEETKNYLIILKKELFESLSIVKEDNEQVVDDFGFDEAGFNDESKKETKQNSSDTSYNLPFQLKVAILANNLDELTATKFNAYTGYLPKTPDIKADIEKGGETIVDRPGQFKIDKEAEAELNRLKSHGNKQAVVSFIEDKYLNLPPEEREQAKKWLKDKDFNIISYSNGTITNKGKAVLNFLGSFLSGHPTTEDDKLLLNSKYTSAFKNNAVRILYSFYNLVLRNFVARMLNKPVGSLTSDEIGKIEEIVSDTIMKLVSGNENNSYDPSKNLGAWFITTSLNAFRDYLKEFTKQTPNFEAIKEELNSRQTSDTENIIRIKSKISPEEIRGGDESHYSDVEKSKDGLYVYKYKSVEQALADFKGGITGTKKIVPPLTHLLYKNLPREEQQAFYSSIRKSGPEHATRYDKEAHGVGKETEYQEYKGLDDKEVVYESKKLLTLALEYILNKTDFTANNINKKDASALYKKSQVEKTKNAYEEAKAKGSRNTEAYKQQYEQRLSEYEQTQKTQRLLVDYIYGLLSNVKPTGSRKAFEKGAEKELGWSFAKSYKEIEEYTDDFNAETLRQYKSLPENSGRGQLELTNELIKRNLWIGKDLSRTVAARLMSVLKQFFTDENISKKLNYSNQDIWNKLVELTSYSEPTMYTQRTFEEQQNNNLMEIIRKQIRKTISLLFEAEEDFYYDSGNDVGLDDVEHEVGKIINGKFPKASYDSAVRTNKKDEFSNLTKNLMFVYKNPNIDQESKKNIENYLMYAFFPKGTRSLMMNRIGEMAGIQEMWKLPKDHEYFDLMYDAAIEGFNYFLENFNTEKGSSLSSWIYNNTAKRFLNKLQQQYSHKEGGETIRHQNISMDQPIDSDDADSGTIRDTIASPDNQEKMRDKKELSKVIMDYMMRNIAKGKTNTIVMEKVAEGLRPDEIAEELNLDPRNVRVALYRLAQEMTNDIRNGKFAKHVKNTIGFDVNQVPRIKKIANGDDNFTFYFIGLNEWYDTNDLMMYIIMESVLEKLQLK